MAVVIKGPLSEEEYNDVCKKIKFGSSVVFPTETVYGIGTNALLEGAVNKIFEIKEREKGKPLIVLISDICELTDIVEEPNLIERKLMNAFWPGALTIIFKLSSNSKLPSVVSGGGDTIGIRMTSNSVARSLIKGSGVPIVAPSANISGEATGVDISVIKNTLGDRVDYILDYGNIESDVPSTIVRVVDGEVLVLREGVISINDINNALLRS